MKTKDMNNGQLTTLMRFYLDFVGHKEVNLCQNHDEVCVFLGDTVPPNAEKHLFMKRTEHGGYLVGFKNEGEVETFSLNNFVPFSDVLDNLYPLIEKHLIEKVPEAA